MPRPGRPGHRGGGSRGQDGAPWHQRLPHARRHYRRDRPPLTLDVGSPAVKSIADIKEVIRARAAILKAGEWIRGAGWNEGYLDECLADRSRHITRWDLDEVAPENPVYLVSFTQHELVANSKACR